MKFLFCFFVLTGMAAGQCVGPTCPILQSGSRPVYSQNTPNYSKSPAATCKITNLTRTGIAHGSGILVDKNDTKGLVLTTAHTFREHGSIMVTFPDGKTYKARLESIDHTWDMAALIIASPEAKPIKLANMDPRVGDRVFAGGYGNNGRWAWVSGPVRGYVSPEGANKEQWLAWHGRARNGDSGGPVINQSGELVAIVSNTDAEPGRFLSRGPFFHRIKIFLKGLRERFRIRQPSPRIPIRNQQPPTTVPPIRVPSREPRKSDKQGPLVAKPKTQKKQQAGDITGGRLVGPLGKLPAAAKKLPEAVSQLPPEVKAGFWPLIGKAFGVSAMTAGTVASGGTGAIAASMGMWALGWLRRKRKGVSATDPAGQFSRPLFISKPELHPRNPEEARQFLRLSEMEGRDPLYDGLVGRLTLDALQETIDSQDTQKATFARELKARLETQVNQMVPLAV